MSFLIEQDQTLVCLGDSITQNPSGYVGLVAALIAAKYPERGIRVVNAGIGGNKAPDMLARLESDVIPHRPDWVTVNVGINDVWHGLDSGGTGGVPVDAYEAALDQIVTRLQHETDAQAVLVTPTVIGEDVEADANQVLTEYVAAMRRVSERRGTRLAPAHADFLMTLRAGQAARPDFRMTTDGVHMTPVGDARLALTILDTLGF